MLPKARATAPSRCHPASSTHSTITDFLDGSRTRRLRRRPQALRAQWPVQRMSAKGRRRRRRRRERRSRAQTGGRSSAAARRRSQTRCGAWATRWSTGAPASPSLATRRRCFAADMLLRFCMSRSTVTCHAETHHPTTLLTNPPLLHTRCQVSCFPAIKNSHGSA